jgi:hypothetical protein
MADDEGATMDATRDGLAVFAGAGHWLRCNLHAHTTNSDGMLTPPMLRRYYALGGYDVLAVTDHDQLTPPPELDPRHPDHLLLVSGAELSLRAPVSGGPLHVLALGITSLPEVTLGSSFAEAVGAIEAVGGVAILAHPWWSGLLPEELDRDALARCVAMEVFNAGCEVEQGRGNSAQYWDALLASGLCVNAVATDDHHLPGFDAFRGWTMARVAERTPEAVVAALRAGAFYSSCGPAILDVRVDAGSWTITTTPAHSVAALGQPPLGTRVNADAHGLREHGETRLQPSGWREGLVDGELLTEARFPRLPGWRYVRFEVADARGRVAWTNPLWLD